MLLSLSGPFRDTPCEMRKCNSRRRSAWLTRLQSRDLTEPMLSFIPCIPVHGKPIPHLKQSSPPYNHNPVKPSRRSTVSAKVDLTRPSSFPFDNLSALSTRLPQPVVIARRQLNQDFAVLLMRSGYAAVDELDFVPMQQFQAVFFDIRSKEWEKFIKKNFGMRQGIIADPRYFDFISYAQMLTIQHFMREPQVVFEEAFGEADGSFNTRVVKRDVGRYPTPESLLIEWENMVGDKVYQRMTETVKRPAAIMGADSETVMRGIRDIYDYFYLAGFCLDIRWTDTNAGQMGCRVEMVAPCILWGCEALRRLKSIPTDYDCYCVRTFCDKCGVSVDCKTKFTESSIVREWSI